jgi:hypothetical protein
LPNAEGVSPELALVDPQLADVARSTLPQEDTLARIELLVRAHRIFDSRSLVRAEPHAAPTERVEQSEPIETEPIAPAEAPARAPAVAPGRTGHRRAAVVAGGLAAAAIASALLVGVRIDLSGQPAGADSSVISVPPIGQPGVRANPSKPVAKPKPRRTTPAPRRKHPTHSSRHRSTAPKPKLHNAAQGRRFVWAPAHGASGYRVQFFRGSTLVFEATTKKPEVTLPARWILRGVRRSLTPGSYRWNVWPITPSGQRSKAIVQAELVVDR